MAAGVTLCRLLLFQGDRSPSLVLAMRISSPLTLALETVVLIAGMLKD